MTKVMYTVMAVIIAIMVTVGISYYNKMNDENTVNKNVSCESVENVLDENVIMETVLVENYGVNEI